MSKLHIKKGDTVAIIAGVDKGDQGKVLSVDVVSNRAIVEGKNMVSKHTKPDAANPQGGIIKKEAGIHLSNLMVIDGKGNVTRVGRRKEGDQTVRYSKKSNEVL
jgi:large subunit ribosomal protein L24